MRAYKIHPDGTEEELPLIPIEDQDQVMRDACYSARLRSLLNRWVEDWQHHVLEVCGIFDDPVLWEDRDVQVLIEAEVERGLRNIGNNVKTGLKHLGDWDRLWPQDQAEVERLINAPFEFRW